MHASSLLWAIRQGNFDAVVLLVSRGADIHARDKDGRDVFMTAAGAGFPHILAYLLAKYNLKNKVYIYKGLWGGVGAANRGRNT